MTKLIHSEDAKKVLGKKDTVFIDVRSPAEYGSVHIPNSYNLPLDEIDNYIEKLEHLDKHIVLVCRSGKRAGMACEKISHIKNKDIKVLDGGITSWLQHNFPVITGKQIWDIERQVRFTAGALVFIGILLGFFVNSYWYTLSGAVGFGLMFAALTNTCAMGYLFSKLPYNKSNDYKNDLQSLF